MKIKILLVLITILSLLILTSCVTKESSLNEEIPTDATVDEIDSVVEESVDDLDSLFEETESLDDLEEEFDLLDDIDLE